MAALTAEAEELLLDVPEQANVGAPLEVHWQGGPSVSDFITIVPADTAEGKYEACKYARESPVTR